MNMQQTVYIYTKILSEILQKLQKIIFFQKPLDK